MMVTPRPLVMYVLLSHLLSFIFIGPMYLRGLYGPSTFSANINTFREIFIDIFECFIFFQFCKLSLYVVFFKKSHKNLCSGGYTKRTVINILSKHGMSQYCQTRKGQICLATDAFMVDPGLRNNTQTAHWRKWSLLLQCALIPKRHIFDVN